MQKAYINQGLSILSDILNDNKVKNIFLVAGVKGYSSIKHLIKPYFQKINIEIFFVSDSNFKTVISGCDKLKQCNSDLMIAIGGGRIIDIAKLISTAGFSDNNYENIIKGKENLKNKFLPLLVMPTTAGTGSEATCFSVMYLEEKKYSIVSEHLVPDYVIADTSLVQEMPSYLKACTFFDAFSQAIESYWAVNATDTSRIYSKKAIHLIKQSVKNYFNKDDEKTLKSMVEAAYNSGRAINESRTTLPHALSYFFTIRHNIPHGHAVALTLGFIGRLNSKLGDQKLKTIMRNITDMLEIDTKDFENFWYDLMKEVNLEVKLSNLNVKHEELDLIIDSVNLERAKNHPLFLDKKILIKELNKIF